MPIFSIITICRNNLQELQYTYKSIHSQSFDDFEWVVVDGNSSDGTKEWLRSLNPGHKWVSEPDKGIFDAMNKGIKLSSGKYLIFINSGDALFDNSVLFKVFEKQDKGQLQLAFIYGDSIDIDESGNEFYRKAKKHSLIKRGMITQHQAMFFNKNLLPELNFDLHYKLTADYSLVCDTISKAGDDKILKVDFPICRFSMGGTNEIYRFKALFEDYKTRRNILKLSILESVFLFFLHFIHALLKKAIPSIRFFQHKRVKSNIKASNAD